MAVRTCWRCLTARSSIFNPSAAYPALRNTIQTFTFSTSAPLARKPNSPAARKGVQVKPVRSGRTLRLSKNTRAKTVRPPAVGERKALRKRIVLSNTNAFEVPGLIDWSAENVADGTLLGRMVGLPGTTVDGLRAVESFKATQGWGFFRRPATLVRKETLELARHIVNPVGNTMRRLVMGEKLAGKSVLVLQAHAMALLKGWVVIHVPNAPDLVVGNTSYAPIPNTTPTLYSQKDYTAALLAATLNGNERVLSKLSLSSEHPSIPIPLQKNLSLARLADLGARDADIAWPVFEALWSELTSTTAERPPMMLSLDGIVDVSRFSQYLAASMHFIHAHDLALVRWFMNCLSGEHKLPHGGLVLAADCQSHRHACAALDLAVKQSEEARVQSGAKDGELSTAVAKLPVFDPAQLWTLIDERSLRALRTVEVMRVKGFSKDEARAVLEYYAQSGMLRQTITETLVSEKWTLAGGGVVGELERSTIRAGM